MKEDLDVITKKTKIIENKLKIFGLENLPINNHTQQNEVQKFELEIYSSNLKYNVARMESYDAKLFKEIEKTKKSINLLKECLTNQIDTRELNKGFEKRQILINKLKSKQFSNEHPVLRIIQKLREINKEN